MLRWNVGGPGGMPPAGMNPDAFAAKFAQENGISIDEAKQQLRARYGDPQQPGMSMNEAIPGLQFSGEGRTLELNPYEAVPQDPQKLEKFISDGAKKAGCSKMEFAQMMGLPDRQSPNSQEVKSASANDLSATSNSEKDANDEIRLSGKDRKAWIKNYQSEHGCSKKEAKEAFKQEYSYDVMSHKDAKSWIKNYKAEHNCSTKEAKNAFRETFGYDVPLSAFAKVGRAIIAPIFGAAVTLGAAPVAGVAGLAMGGGATLAGGLGSVVSGAITGIDSSDLVYKHKSNDIAQSN